ncbi:flavin reductase family protein [Rhizobium paknamense]|uniref:Flavin reductase (DIM6/NTAB) family NADH-FMN oxidoreductase RutF n=1 Tax=Rhizobium paknamense TaxID=1206817 RepID=A0ABU0IE28_9HYPH|nr:flavin reductase family protein [Rhizobium paknamense]MDQ0455947.1 flavin reductase (DIM6/NTAB) family NADH-FMN oxidoreductase RutF [Rhizobium paknamense]
MFYETATNQHGLPHDPFKAIVSPRPIGWIGTKAADGSLNLAPYSFFNAISDRPKLVMFSSSGRKDSVRNIEETGCFTANFVSHDLLQQMNTSSAPFDHGVSEFERAGLTPVTGRLVAAPYVAEAMAVLECQVTEIMVPKDISGGESENIAVFGQVLGIHIAERALRDGRFDVTLAQPVSRLGYMDYATVTEVFELRRPQAK